MQEMPLQQQSLFGGAIFLRIPSTYFDVSSIRQIPDNQEVWLERNGDASLIVELVESCTAPVPGLFYWSQLIEDNSARSQEITKHTPPNLGFRPFIDDANCTVELVEGTQSIAKFNTDVFQEVSVWLAVLRLPRVGSDLLITWNDPSGTVNEGIFKEVVESLGVADWNLFVDEH